MLGQIYIEIREVVAESTDFLMTEYETFSMPSHGFQSMDFVAFKRLMIFCRMMLPTL